MSKYKLVPVEPTIEMLAELGFNGDYELAVGHAAICADLEARYRAMLTAAPAVQGEPVAVVDADDDGMWAEILPDVTVKVGQILYAAPQPVEQRQYYYKMNSCKALSADSDQCICWHNEGEGPPADGSATHWRSAVTQREEQQECGCCGQTVRCDDDCDAVVLRKAEQQPVEQQPAPDVSALVEALEAALGSFDDWCEGQDPSDIADAIDTFPWVMQARTALAAHRKQGGES